MAKAHEVRAVNACFRLRAMAARASGNTVNNSANTPGAIAQVRKSLPE